jgi:hypothetical protein
VDRLLLVYNQHGGHGFAGKDERVKERKPRITRMGTIYSTSVSLNVNDYYWFECCGPVSNGLKIDRVSS